MSLPIRDIPVLTGKAAKEFKERAEEAYKNKGTVDYSKQFERTRIILKNAKL